MSTVGAGDALWRDLMGTLASLPERVTAETTNETEEADRLRYLLRFLRAGIALCVEYDETETPALTHMIEDRMSWGLDSPDCLYLYCRIRAGGTYRVGGTRGGSRAIDVQVNAGHYADGKFGQWPSVAVVAGDDLTVDADGGIDVVIGGPPRDHDWLPLDDRDGFLLIRQYFGDWEREAPATLTIERLDGPPTTPALTLATMAERIALLQEWLTAGARTWDEVSKGLAGPPMADIEPFLVPAGAGGLSGQAYGMGSWHCRPDEAVVVEFDLPASCRLWSVSLCDRTWQSIDFSDRQSSLNSAQCTPTADGRFVGAITHDDPGLANWLDPGGHTGGSFAVRFLDADPTPTVRFRTVGRADLDLEIGADAPRVDADTRRAALRSRRIGVQRRYR
ncbi:MAG: DUF1214 domain-containing protein [Acidimicrobiia bacterium]|jgi:hypothetical protein